jgi:glutamate-5-semialdehyde dehydrogenase
MQDFLQKVKTSTKIISSLDTKTKNKLLNLMAQALVQNKNKIIQENKKDLEYGKQNNLTSSLMDRLLLNEERIKSMSEAIQQIASQKEPVGRILDGWVVQSGLRIEKVSVPIGVIAIIYESRPNVTSDTAALCFKSGNACILKGGKEAYHSNKIIADILQEVLEQNGVDKNVISLLPDSSREAVAKIITMDKYIDLIIPRGGEALIKYISQNASVPVVKHDKGLCHTYLHKDCDEKMAINIAINAKTNRPGVCNAMETLLVDENIAKDILPKLETEFKKHNTLLKGCEKTTKILSEIQDATSEDFDTEYLDNILSIKVVQNENEAIEHITKYGSSHSEAIVTNNHTIAEKFLNQVDASSVYINASTRFTDGGEFGLGAEVGISTNKLHSRGPMGIEDLTTYKYKVYGSGQIK